MIRRHLLAPADNRRLAHLCGPVDQHLRRIEAAMAVTLSRREGALRIEGPRDAVERTAALIDQLYEKAREPIGRARGKVIGRGRTEPIVAAAFHLPVSAAKNALLWVPTVQHMIFAPTCGKTEWTPP